MGESEDRYRLARATSGFRSGLSDSASQRLSRAHRGYRPFQVELLLLGGTGASGPSSVDDKYSVLTLRVSRNGMHWQKSVLKIKNSQRIALKFVYLGQLITEAINFSASFLSSLKRKVKVRVEKYERD